MKVSKILYFLSSFCLAYVFFLFVKEVFVFAQKEVIAFKKIIHCGNKNLVQFQGILPQKLFDFDLNYKYNILNRKQDLSEWCAEIMNEAISVYRIRYLVVTNIYFFKRNDPNFEIFMTFEPQKQHHLVIVIPQTTKKCYLNDVIFKENSVMVSTSNQQGFSVCGEAFLIVTLQRCKAWEI